MGPPPRPYPRWIYVFVLLGFFVLMAAAPLVGRVLPLPRRVDRSLVQLFLTMGGMVVAMVGVLVVVVIDIRRNGRWIDWALASAGLRSEAYMMRGRQARGVVAGRKVTVYWLPASRYTPASLELMAECGARTRLAVGPQVAGGFLSGLARPQMDTGDPAMAHLRVSADDDAWARALLGDQSARTSVLRLAAPAVGEGRWVRIEPGAVHLRASGIRTDDLSPEIVRPAVQELVNLAAAIERAPAPMQPAEATALERAMRDRRGITIFVVVAVVVLLAVSLGVAAALVSTQMR